VGPTTKAGEGGGGGGGGVGIRVSPGRLEGRREGEDGGVEYIDLSEASS
jgi:hypothetical protein